MDAKSSEAAYGNRRFFRRRSFFLKKKLQLRFAAFAAALLLCSTLSVWVAMNWIFNKYLAEALSQSASGFSFMMRSNISVLSFILADAVVIFILTVYFSRLVVGPLFRFEETLRAIIAGEKPNLIRLRKDDFLKETADLINQLLKNNSN